MSRRNRERRAEMKVKCKGKSFAEQLVEAMAGGMKRAAGVTVRQQRGQLEREPAGIAREWVMRWFGVYGRWAVAAARPADEQLLPRLSDELRAAWSQAVAAGADTGEVRRMLAGVGIMIEPGGP